MQHASRATPGASIAKLPEASTIFFTSCDDSASCYGSLARHLARHPALVSPAVSSPLPTTRMITVRMSYRSSHGSSQGGLCAETGPPVCSFLKLTSPSWGHKRPNSLPFIPKESIRENPAIDNRPSSSPATDGLLNIQKPEDEQRSPRINAVVREHEGHEIDLAYNHGLTTSSVSANAPRMIMHVESPALVHPSSLSSKQDTNSSRLKLSRAPFDMESPNTTTSQPPPRLPSDAHRTLHDLDIGLLGSQISQAEPSSSTLKWQRILKLRESNWGLRSQAQEIRNNLRQKQYVKSEADDMLFRRINGMMHMGAVLLPNGQKTLEELKDECQKARDAYGPLEDECNRLEDQLSRQEYKLTQLEKDFYGTSIEPPTVLIEEPAGSQEPEIRQPGTSSITSQEDKIEESEYHPLVTKYLSKLGDLDLYRERLDDHFDEREQLEEEKESRLRFGMTLDPDDQTWLENSPQELQELNEKIRHLEKELETMKRECISRGLLDEYGEPTSFESREEKSFVYEEDMDPENEKSEYVKYPLLLPHPGILKYERSGSYEPKPDERSDTATNRINRWMLERLRYSPLDVNLLARTFEAIFGDTYEDWQFAVLNFWYRDGTVKTTAGIQVYTSTRSRSLTTQAPAEDLISESSEPSPKKPKKDPSFRILVTSSLRDSSDRSDATQLALGVCSSPDSPISPR